MSVPVTYCPSARPYLSNTECIDCPDEQKYFDFAEEICKDCLPGLLCKSAWFLHDIVVFIIYRLSLANIICYSCLFHNIFL